MIFKDALHFVVLQGIEFYVAWGFSFSRNDLFWKRCMNRMLREDFSLTRNVLLWQGFRVLYCVRYALTRNGVLAKTAVWYVAWDFCIIYCVGFSLIRNDLPWQELWIVGCVRFSLTRNDLLWQWFLSHKLREVYRWPETTCLGRDLWVMCCVRFWLTRNNLPWQGFLNHKLREVFRWSIPSYDAMCKGCMENSLQDFIAISHCWKTSALARTSNENNFHCNIPSLAFSIAILFIFHWGFFVCLNDSNEKKYSLQELFVGSDESIAFFDWIHVWPCVAFV